MNIIPEETCYEKRNNFFKVLLNLLHMKGNKSSEIFRYNYYFIMRSVTKVISSRWWRYDYGMLVEWHWQGDTRLLRNKPAQCHFVQHKSQAEWSNQRLHSERPATNCLDMSRFPENLRGSLRSMFIRKIHLSSYLTENTYPASRSWIFTKWCHITSIQSYHFFIINVVQ